MDKLNLTYMRPQSARGYRYLAVPKELIENLAFSGLDFGAIILYAKMLERASLSARHEDKFTDENGRLFIIYTVEQMERDLQRSHPTVIKLTKHLYPQRADVFSRQYYKPLWTSGTSWPIRPSSLPLSVRKSARGTGWTHRQNPL